MKEPRRRPLIEAAAGGAPQHLIYRQVAKTLGRTREIEAGHKDIAQHLSCDARADRVGAARLEV